MKKIYPVISGNSPTILAEILQTAAKTDQKIVYIQPDKSEKTQTYKDLLLEAQKILSGLRKFGLKPQEKVVFQIESYQDFISSFWGCVLGGFVPVPVRSINYTPEQINKTTSRLAHTLQMLEQPLLLTDVVFAEQIPQIPELSQVGKFPVLTVEELCGNEPDTNWHSSQPDDVAVMMFTSGSTGIPKGVVLSHRNLLSQTMGSVQMNGFTRKDISLSWVPIDHVGGLVYFHIRDVYLGSKQIHFPFELFLQEPLIWLDLIDRFKVNIAFGPNFAYSLINDCAETISKRQWNLSSIKFFLNAAEPIVTKTARRFLQLLAPYGLAPTVMCPSWGMAEVSSGATFSHNFSLDSTTDYDLFVEVGSPIPGVDLRIVEDQNQVVSEGEIGGLQVKGLTVMSGYYQNPEANQNAFTQDGWFNTGDLGFLQDGRLTITGRQKDLIIICGTNYYCHDLEAVVEEIAGIEVSYTAACAVRESEDNTDKLAIFFSATDTEDNSLQVLMQKIRDKIVEKIGVSPNYLIPVSKETIPKTAIGKIQRQELRKRFEAGKFNGILTEVTLQKWQ
ncbi:MAG: AMP-binding protein [Okeania sp. SIO2G4]|uniref:AMP-binding protein n=1 Tax=unclassified Okeania TaxID=2634635 RepID=UPI0013B719AE|nr:MULTISPECIES: AMP-binding protein [unclassified Okeania]NEP72196.1 AMP-binding protein [Okeania sp. SIO2G5]NEP94687.1 AMP-binding protein [Okeania sp. SIO2F5]NEQ90810.1 AMP-binding protein [Okeania sp. SIO2G4]